MLRPTTFRQIALGVSLPTFTVSPAVAKATIYMPSHVAARVLGGRSTQRHNTSGAAARADQSIETPHAA